MQREKATPIPQRHINARCPETQWRQWRAYLAQEGISVQVWIRRQVRAYIQACQERERERQLREESHGHD